MSANQETQSSLPHVSMQDFLRSGQFGPVKIGDPAAKLKANFGEPNKVAEQTRRNPIPAIWKYGDVEFHLTKDGKTIWLIFCDAFHQLNLGPEIPFDPWFFQNHANLEIVENELTVAGLNFRRVQTRKVKSTLYLRLDSGVELLFTTATDRMLSTDKPLLIGFQHVN